MTGQDETISDSMSQLVLMMILAVIFFYLIMVVQFQSLVSPLVGEECTEIVIAAKNPDKEEIKYEISDFLYHAMVLMVEKGVTWEEITRELARR